MFDEKRDAMALAAVTALLLGCRASEVLHVRVRDLDCGGTRQWIAARDSEYGGKTHNAARSPDVPEVLHPRLLRLSSGKRPEDYLFGVTRTGKPKHPQILHAAVRRVCVAAGVPVVCPHSLRGLWPALIGAEGATRSRYWPVQGWVLPLQLSAASAYEQREAEQHEWQQPHPFDARPPPSRCCAA